MKWDNKGDLEIDFYKPLLKTDLPLIKNLLKTLAKSVLLPFQLTAASSATGAVVHKKMFRSRRPSNLTQIRRD